MRIPSALRRRGGTVREGGSRPMGTRTWAQHPIAVLVDAGRAHMCKRGRSSSFRGWHNLDQHLTTILPDCPRFPSIAPDSLLNRAGNALPDAGSSSRFAGPLRHAVRSSGKRGNVKGGPTTRVLMACCTQAMSHVVWRRRDSRALALKIHACALRGKLTS